MSKKPDTFGIFLAVVIALTGIGVLMFGVAFGVFLSWFWS